MHDSLSDHWLISVGAQDAPVVFDRAIFIVLEAALPWLSFDQRLQAVLLARRLDKTALPAGNVHGLIVKNANVLVITRSSHSYRHGFASAGRDPVTILPMSE